MEWIQQWNKSIKIHEGVEDTGENTFANLKNLETVYIPDSLKRMGDRAFYGCTNLENVSLPNSRYQMYYGEDVFYGCIRAKKEERP